MTQGIYAPDYTRYIQSLEKRIRNLELASLGSENARWKTIADVTGRLIDSNFTATGTRFLNKGSATTFTASAVDVASPPQGLIYIDPASYTINGIPPKFRVLFSVTTNATAPANIIRGGLSEITAYGGVAYSQSYTFSGQETYYEIDTPGTSSFEFGYSPEIILDAPALYILTVYISAACVANSNVILDLKLQVNTG